MFAPVIKHVYYLLSKRINSSHIVISIPKNDIDLDNAVLVSAAIYLQSAHL